MDADRIEVGVNSLLYDPLKWDDSEALARVQEMALEALTRKFPDVEDEEWSAHFEEAGIAEENDGSGIMPRSFPPGWMFTVRGYAKRQL